MKNKEMFRLLRLPDEYESIFDAIEILFLFLDELRENSFVDERPRTVLISQKIKKLIQLYFPQSYTLQIANSIEGNAQLLDSYLQGYFQRFVDPNLSRNPSGIDIIGNGDQAKNLHQLRGSAATIESFLDQLLARLPHRNEFEIYFENIYSSSISVKKQIRDLIESSIEIIEQDNTLSPSTRKKLITHLHQCLSFLDNDNKTSFLGYVKEAIIVLGALGSFAGGYYAFSEARSKLEDAEQIVEQSSVNYTYIQSGNHSEYFNSPPLLTESLPQKKLSSSTSDDSQAPIEMEAELAGDRPTQEELMKIVEELDGCAKTDKPAPSDEEVEEMLIERLVEKYK